MKGAFLVAEDPQLFIKVRDALVKVGASTATDGAVVQIRDERGNLLTVFRDIPSSTEWEWRQGPFDVQAIGRLPDFEAATACWIECRSERAFSAMVRHIAEQLPEPAWVVDGEGALWLAAELDPERLRL